MFLTLRLMILPCFLLKIVQIVQKVIIFFPRGNEIEPCFWQIWYPHDWSFSVKLLSSILVIFMDKQGLKIRPKVQTLGSFFFSIKPRILKNFSKNFWFFFFFVFVFVFFFASILPGQFWQTGPYLGSKSRYPLRATNFFCEELIIYCEKFCCKHVLRSCPL